ncbi:hypothetical protein FOA52_007798 [Chlamydomonas sp. UWO 241]|nr:hypothetical protein FOA52_007798 [Chlamydomonas sp. UWO 241]
MVVVHGGHAWRSSVLLLILVFSCTTTTVVDAEHAHAPLHLARRLAATSGEEHQHSIKVLDPRLRGEEDLLKTHLTDSWTAVADLVVPHGYPLEEHFVTTTDGYIMRVFRIPHGVQSGGDDTHSSSSSGSGSGSGSDSGSGSGSGSGSSSDDRGDAARPVVVLQHALLDSCAGFLVLGPGKALALLLADEGYDVWLANSRGNVHSRNHTTLSVDSDAFWAFSFDDMAALDLPAMLDYALGVSGAAQASLVGFSQGSILVLAALASGSVHASKVSSAVVMAPAAFLQHVSSTPLRTLAAFNTDSVFTLLGVREFLPSSTIIQMLEGAVCFIRPKMCLNVLAAIAGFNEDTIDPEKLPIFLRYTPAGTSVQNMAHWAQCVRQKHPHTLAYFDYGTSCNSIFARKGVPACNKDRYGADAPPTYDFSAITTPLLVMSGSNDQLADPRDVESLLAVLGSAAAVVSFTQVPSFQHLDFVWADNADTKAYTRVIDFLAPAPM